MASSPTPKALPSTTTGSTPTHHPPSPPTTSSRGMALLSGVHHHLQASIRGSNTVPRPRMATLSPLLTASLLHPSMQARCCPTSLPTGHLSTSTPPHPLGMGTSREAGRCREVL
jgi:hypothetical protein